MVDLNHINLQGWKDDPNVANEISKRIETAVWRDSIFEPLMGGSENRVLRVYKTNRSNPKGAFTPRLKSALSGLGVTGNSDFDTNYDKLELHSLTVYPISYGNALKSEIELNETMRQVDFLKEATDSLYTWMKQKVDRVITVTMCNDFTNAVICDNNTGYKDTNNKTIQETTKTITEDDILNLKAIKRAIYMAKRGIGYDNKERFPIKPIHISYKEGVGELKSRLYQYVILVDTVGAEQLKSDPDWIELQKVNVRGLENNLFTGLLGMVDNCLIIDVGTWQSQNTGLLHSEVSDDEFKLHLNIQNLNGGNVTPPSFYSGDKKIGYGVLLGASALIYATAKTPTLYIDDTQDLGRKMAVGIDRICAIAKSRWKSHSANNSILDNTDFATIGIFYSHKY